MKLLQFLALTCLAIVIAGVTTASDQPMFWLASGVPAFLIIRAVLAGILIVQLFTRPPRHTWFRVLTGSLATTTVIWALYATAANGMQILDTLSILGASITILATSLERFEEKVVLASESQTLLAK